MEQVEEDLLCVGCGYNLRHARVEGKCPECGRDVAGTIAFQLRNADPKWLRKISLGMALMVAQQIAVVGNVFPVVLMSVVRPIWGGFEIPGYQWIGGICADICMVLLVLGGGQVTAVERGRGWFAIVGRVLVVLAAVMTARILINIALSLAKVKTSMLTPEPAWAAQIEGLIVPTLTSVALIICGRIGWRSGDLWLKRSARVLAVLQFVPIAALVLEDPAAKYFPRFFGILIQIFWDGEFVVAMGGIFVFWRGRRRVREAIESRI